jgi:translation initiation factor IF-2
MSVRIYQLSKELEISNKELIEILKQKGLEVNSPSNTIPNIYADTVRDEFKNRTVREVPKEEVAITVTKHIEEHKAALLEPKAELPSPQEVPNKTEEPASQNPQPALPSTSPALLPNKTPAQPTHLSG